MRKEIGLLLVGGGIALAWLLKKYRFQFGPYEREIHLVTKGGVCGIEAQPADITIENRFRPVLWRIYNAASQGSPCDREVEVCLDRWEYSPSEAGERRPIEDPPLLDLDLDLHHGNRRFCRTVGRGDRRTIPAIVKPGANRGYYWYTVLVDGEPAVDPMIRIVP